MELYSVNISAARTPVFPATTTTTTTTERVPLTSSCGSLKTAAEFWGCARGSEVVFSESFRFAVPRLLSPRCGWSVRPSILLRGLQFNTSLLKSMIHLDVSRQKVESDAPRKNPETFRWRSCKTMHTSNAHYFSADLIAALLHFRF